MDDEDLETRVATQFSSLYLTLVSVMVGLVLSDLFSSIHARMTLTPLNWETARTWCQILGNSLAVLAAWVLYTHLGLLRRRLPTIWDTVDALLVLVTIPLNANTGRQDSVGWFVWAAAYSFLGMCAIRINVWQAAQEARLSHLPRIARFGGPITFLYLGGPLYLALAAAAHERLLSPPLEVAATSSAIVAAVAAAPLFMREWRVAVLQDKPTAATRTRSVRASAPP